MTLLFPCPEQRIFKSNQLVDLEAHLDGLEYNTEVIAIDNVAEVSLDKLKGVTRAGGNKLTATAMTQIAQVLCPGLARVIADLCGLNVSDRQLAPQLAVTIFNDLLATRFDQLKDKSLIQHLKLKRIDGIIGTGYQYLSNKNFLTLAQEAIEQSDVPCKFHEATLYGRSLVLCFLYNRPITPEYEAGFYFANSEIGDGSVRVAWLLLRSNTDERAIMPTKRGRMVHTGRNFASRVASAMLGPTNRPYASTARSIITGLQQSREQTLGLGNLSDKQVMARVEELISRLTRRGLGNQLAERIIYSALNRGTDEESSSQYDLELRKPLWSSRTEYDLFLALIRDAKTRALTVRESIERIAYDVLLGKLSLS